MEIDSPHIESSLTDQHTNHNTNIFQFKNINIIHKNNHILNNINGFVNPGEFLALMGPSGAGKTTLLNHLCGRRILSSSTKCSGDITNGGVEMTNKDFREVGYVMQQDTFLPKLTVRDTIIFYAKVKLPDTYTINQKIQRAYEVIELVNLTPSLDTNIGGNIIRGLSGGERKRVSVAVELITNPSLLFLDEPTSGLDSSMSYGLIHTLQSMARRFNLVVVSSIHQPSSQTFDAFDNLLLLSQGQTMYFGPIKKLGEFYKILDMPCPKGWNVADYSIDLARESTEIKQKIILKAQEFCVFSPDSSSDNQKPHEFELFETEHTNSPVKKLEKISFSHVFSAILNREFWNSVSENWTILNFAENILMGLLFGVVWFSISFTDRHYNSITGLIFIMSVNIFIQPMFTSIFSYANEAEVLKKDMLSNMYKLSVYYLAKTVADIPTILMRPLLLVSIMYWMVGFSKSVYFLPTLFTWMFQGIMGQSVGLMFGTMGLGRKETLIISILYFIFALLLGGFFSRNLPSWIAWGRYTSPVFYAFSLIIHIQFNSMDGVLCTSNTVSQFQGCLNNNKRASASEIFKYENLPEPYWVVIPIMFGSMIIFRILAFIYLKVTIMKKRVSLSIHIPWFNTKKYLSNMTN